MTGQLIARGPYDGPNGKKVWILLGLVTDEEGSLQPETQYTIAIPPTLCNPVEVKTHTIGNTLDGIVRQPIWRV